MRASPCLPALGNAGIQARLAMGCAPDDPLLHVSFTTLANTAGARQPGPAIATAGLAILDALGQVGLARTWHAVPLPSPPPTARPLSRGPSRWTAGTRATWPASCIPPA